MKRDSLAQSALAGCPRSALAPLMPTSIALLLVLAYQSPAAAQGGIAVGGGLGTAYSAKLQGSGEHLQLSVPLRQADARPLPRDFTLRIEALAQRSSMYGAYCERMREEHCIGRTDDSRLIGAGIYGRYDLIEIKRVRLYATPLGVGLYYRKTRSHEAEGPIWNCFVGTTIVSCPSNAPWSFMSYAESRVSPGITNGLGLEVPVRGVMLGLEMRVHRLLEGKGSRAAAVPFTLGIRF